MCILIILKGNVICVYLCTYVYCRHMYTMQYCINIQENTVLYQYMYTGHICTLYCICSSQCPPPPLSRVERLVFYLLVTLD
jgi:hypothetical protein